MLLSVPVLISSKYKPRSIGKPDLTQRVQVQCDECSKEYDSDLRNREKNLLIYFKDLCSGCKLRVQYSQGLRKEQSIKAGEASRLKMKGKTIDKMYSPEKVERIRQLQSQAVAGKKNPNFGGKHSRFEQAHEFNRGKSWEEKMGPEKSREAKKRLSESSSGSGNPMFGKPSPMGSGNGWSGWYKNWYFRSLLELSYMVNVIEKTGLRWKTGEDRDLRIPYALEGKTRTYFCDFLINGDTLIEIKPKKLISSRVVAAKIQAAEKWCENQNLKYSIQTEEDFDRLSLLEIGILLEKGELKFLPRYQVKWEELILKESSC